MTHGTWFNVSSKSRWNIFLDSLFNSTLQKALCTRDSEYQTGKLTLNIALLTLIDPV